MTFLDVIVQSVIVCGERRGVDLSLIANDVRSEIIGKCGGTYVYVQVEDKTERNDAICKQFNGRNINLLAKEYDLTTRQIRKILSKK